jgi:hypothetical protein
MAHPITRIKNFTYQKLDSELQISKDSKKLFEELYIAYLGDYWQKGTGSLLPPATGAHSSTLSNLMEKRFVFRNILKECVGRVSGAFFGKSPDWRFNVDLDEEAFNALDEFWTSNKASEEFSKAFEHRLVTGRGGLRIYIPIKYKVQTIDDSISGEVLDFSEYLSFTTIADAIKAIRVEVVDPRKSRLLDDEGELFSIVKYARRVDWENEETQNVIEFSFVDDLGLTFIGLVYEFDSSNKVNSEFPIESYIGSDGFDLDEKTTYFEMKGDPYVTGALYKNNQLLNLALTCSGFSLVDNGFGEVFLTNVEMDVKQVTGPDGEITEQPMRLKRGGGAVQSLVGIRQISEEGTESYTSPGVHFKEPTQITAFRDGKDLAYRACLEEAGQLYALISGDAAASGESRIQAMKDFYLKIIGYKNEVDQMGSWLMTAVLRWASQLSGVNSDITVSYDSKIFIGDVTKEERRALIDQWKAGVISLETCRVLSGVEDPGLESEMIINEGDVSLDEVTLDEATRRVALANQMIGLLPDRRIRKIAFGYDDTELNRIDEEFIEQVSQQFPVLTEEDNPEELNV